MQGPSDGTAHQQYFATAGTTATATTTTTTAGIGFGAGGVGIDMASDAADESADRALTSVRRKLDQSLSIEYTVNELITTATDPTNLAQIFYGEDMTLPCGETYALAESDDCPCLFFMQAGVHICDI
jgi:FATC domain